MDRRASVIDKVVKMLRLARNAGTDAEAQTAIVLARRLMVAHDLDEADLEEGEPQRQPIDDAVVDASPRHVSFKEYLAAIVGESFRCAVIISEHRATGTVRLVFVGRTADVAVAREAYDAALIAAANLAEEHVRARPASEQDVARGSFLTGFLKGLDARLREDAAATALLVVTDAEVLAHATALANGGDATGGTLPTGDGEALRQGYGAGYDVAGREGRLRGGGEG